MYLKQPKLLDTNRMPYSLIYSLLGLTNLSHTYYSTNLFPYTLRIHILKPYGISILLDLAHAYIYVFIGKCGKSQTLTKT